MRGGGWKPRGLGFISAGLTDEVGGLSLRQSLCFRTQREGRSKVWGVGTRGGQKVGPALVILGREGGGAGTTKEISVCPSLRSRRRRQEKG